MKYSIEIFNFFSGKLTMIVLIDDTDGADFSRRSK